MSKLLESVVLPLAIVVASAVLLWFVFSRLFELMFSLNSDLVSAVFIASIAGLVSIATVVISKRYEGKAMAVSALREKKAQVYEEIICTIFDIFFAEKRGTDAPTEEEIISRLTRITEKLTIWGSNEIVVEFGKFREISARITKDSKENSAYSNVNEGIFAMENLMFAMRKDLGHSNSLKQGNILRLFINDVDKYLK